MIVSTAPCGVAKPMGYAPNSPILTVLTGPGMPWSTIGILNVALDCPRWKARIDFTGVKSWPPTAVPGSAM